MNILEQYMPESSNDIHPTVERSVPLNNHYKQFVEVDKMRRGCSIEEKSG